MLSMVTGEAARPISTWRSSFWGRLFCDRGPWSLRVNPDELSVEVSGLNQPPDLIMLPTVAVTVRAGRIWSTVVLSTSDRPRELPGLPSEQGRGLQAALDHYRHVEALVTPSKEELTKVEASVTGAGGRAGPLEPPLVAAGADYLVAGQPADL